MEAKDAITCARGGDVDFFNTVAREILLKARDERDRSVLTVAALNGHLDCCKAIVESCTQLLYHQNDSPKWSVLHYVAVDNKHENIMRFLITADSKQVLEPGGGAKIPNKRLLAMQDYWDGTALHRAVEYRKHWATKLLLQADHDFELLRMVDKDGRTCLHIAAEKGDHVLVELMIKTKPDNEFLKMTESKWNQTALHIAAQNQKLAIVQLLIEADDSNDLLAMVDSNQQTALHIAAKRGNLEMVKLICDADPDKQLLSMPDEKGNTPLHLASRVEIVRLLTQVDIEAKDAITCAKIGYVDFFKAVAPEILHEARDEHDNTALTVAALEGHLYCCEVIIERCTQLLYHQSSSYKWSVLHKVVAYSADGTNLENILRFLITADSKLGGVGKIPNKKLLTMQDRCDATALHKAVDLGKHWATKLLVEAGRDFGLLRMVDVDGRTCLHFAANDYESAELIIKERPDNEFLKMTESKSNQTALHIAVEKNNIAIVQLLLEADHSNDLLAVVDSHKCTALHIALKRCNLDMVNLMCKAGLDKQLLSMPDEHKKTPLHIVAERCNRDMVELICEADLDKQLLSMLDSQGNTPLHLAIGNRNLAIVKSYPSNDLLGVVDSKQQTTLHYAVGQGNLGVAKLMYKAGLDKQLLSMPDGDGNTLLHLAVKNNNLAIVQVLLEAGNCNDLMRVVDLHQRTALHYAVKQSNLYMVELMCKVGLDKQLLSMPDSQGNTPLLLALLWDPRYGKEIARLLTEVDMAIPCAKRGNVDFFKKVRPEILLRARDASDINTVLTVAAREGHLDCCKVIVERCTPLLYHQDKYKWSVLHDVVRYSKDNLENIMRFLITADSNPDLELGGGAKIPNKRLLKMQTKWGGTALHLAVRFGKHRATELLLQAYHDLELQRMVDNNGRTCLHIATEKGDHVSVKLLEKMAV